MNSSIEFINFNNIKLAVIIRSSFCEDGIHFFTDNKDSLQFGYMKRNKNYLIQPHLHKPSQRVILNTMEFLFIKSGCVEVDFYSEEHIYLSSQRLYRGDAVLLCSGGHGFRFIEKSEIIEIKQGPYLGDVEKERFLYE